MKSKDLGNPERINTSAENKDLYKFFAGNPFWKEGEFKLKTNYWQGTPSSWSLSFDGHCMKDIFKIHDPIFCAKFVQAISGDGQEAEKITTLHSSSLASLMVFFGVSEKNPIHMKIGEGIKVFTRCEFEVKNEVAIGEGNFSNIDVALYGEDSVLFLESKFSEYLYPKPQEVKSTEYYNIIYDRLKDDLKKAHVAKIANKKGKQVLARTGKEAIYCEGLKQMISHYLGIVTEIKNGREDLAGKNVFLGEILFNFSDRVPDAVKKLESYQTAYGYLREGLQRCANEDCKGRLQILPIATYQEVLCMEENKQYLKNLPPRVSQYYRFNEL